MEGQQLDLEGNPVGVPWKVTMKRNRKEVMRGEVMDAELEDGRYLRATVNVMAVAQPEAVLKALDACPPMEDIDTLTITVKARK